jgi:DNA (cytosine-5)-methyltransferase 1
MTKVDIRIGSLCTGYGGLDMAVMAMFGGQFAWCADNDKHVSVILAVRYPGVPNLGDLTTIKWRQTERVDIICAGFPCQDISYNGRGAGIEKGARSGIWKNIAHGIRVLRPKLVVVENVAGIRRRGLDRVLGDLAELRYNALWTSVRASDIGAAHRRERMFILGYRPGAKAILTAAHARGQRRSWRSAARQATSRWSPGGPVGLGARAVSSYGQGDQADDDRMLSVGEIAWGRYGEAIRRWEAATGRRAPQPTEPGTRGQARLSPLLSEWLMGLPGGFVTGLGLPYSAQHRALGNGVVPQQATAALRLLLDIAVSGITGEAAAKQESQANVVQGVTIWNNNQ